MHGNTDTFRDIVLDSAEPAGERPAEYYLHERYKQPGQRRGLLAFYYGVRPLMPRRLQLVMRRMYARKQAKTPFPRWPIEPILVERAERELRALILSSERNTIPLINYWPGLSRASVILTHDVEGEAGVRNIPRVRELEKQYGVVSSWNFVAERYPFDKQIFDVLRAEGCEIGLHGLYHDGKKFSSRAIFEERLPKMNAYLKAWNAVGFRSPATHRNPDWMSEIEAEYDSSFPDSDPFEPQSGGCCSIFPFFLGSMVELPITLVQDHTLIEILGKKDIELWKQKSEWIIAHRGLINIIIHPDYMLTQENLRYYEEFLRFIRSQADLWFALPRDVARWWKERTESRIVLAEESRPRITGPASGKGKILWAQLRNDTVMYKIDHEYNRH